MRYMLSLLLGFVLTMPLLLAQPVSAHESLNLPADHALAAVIAPAPTTTAEHATASASETRMCGGSCVIAQTYTNAISSPSAAPEVGNPATIASRDRLDEEVDEGAYAERYLARGPGDDDDDDAARWHRLT